MSISVLTSGSHWAKTDAIDQPSAKSCVQRSIENAEQSPNKRVQTDVLVEGESRRGVLQEEEEHADLFAMRSEGRHGGNESGMPSCAHFDVFELVAEGMHDLVRDQVASLGTGL